jgi:glycosyltransferase involved in cell wall biosynthesis
MIPSIRNPNGLTILLAANSSWNLLNFRAPIILGLQEAGYRIAAAVPDDEAAPKLRSMGVETHFVPVDARGVSPVSDLRLLLRYGNLLRQLRPAVVLPFTAKPNIYASLAAARERIPVINTLTGLGTGYLSGPTLQLLLSILYRAALARSCSIFFHNEDDRDLFVTQRLVKACQAQVVPGSGVDLERFAPIVGCERKGPPAFLFIGRLLIDKGINEFLEASELVSRERNAEFRVLGPTEKQQKAISEVAIENWKATGTAQFLGVAEDVRPFIHACDCVVLPSFREGLPRVLLEASAMEKPVIATNVPGCRQVVDDGLSGLLCEARSARALADAIIAMIDLSAEARSQMGRRGRLKMEREFSQERVVDIYVKAVRSAQLKS